MRYLKQGTILKVNLNPATGHEQAGYRPAIVISNDYYNKISNGIVIVCPITNSPHEFPLHVPLDSRTKTTGTVQCDQLKSLDLSKRKWRFVEEAPPDILSSVVDVVSAEIEIGQ